MIPKDRKSSKSIIKNDSKDGKGILRKNLN